MSGEDYLCVAERSAKRWFLSAEDSSIKHEDELHVECMEYEVGGAVESWIDCILHSTSYAHRAI